jgi:biopolymer transport protein ExbD
MVERGREVRGTIAAKGLVPLLDTLFQLIFALLVVSGPRAVARAETLLLRLPRVERGEAGAPPSAHEIVLQVDSGARVTLLGESAVIGTRAELDRRLAVALGQGVPEEATVEIRADAAAPHGVVVELLQHLRLLGFADVRLSAVVAAEGRSFFGEGR